MNLLLGPLGSHRGYILHIVLPNCVDYFELCQRQRERDIYEISKSKYERLRLFLNAAESINNIPEYIYHEHKSQYGWKSETEVRNLLAAKSNIHGTINTLANGYKHCVRNPPKKGSTKEIDAHEFQEISVKINIDLGNYQNTNVTFVFESIEDNSILAEAFRFWLEYENNPDLNSLLN